MIEEIKKEFTPFKFLVFLLIVAVSIYLFGVLSSVLTHISDLILIILFAWILSFILEPIVEFLLKLFKLPKIIAALFVYILLGCLISLLIFVFTPLIVSQLETLSLIVPQYFSTLPQLAEFWNNLIKNTTNNVILYIPSFANGILNALIILFLSFYFIVDKERINNEVFKLTPKNWHTNLTFIQKVIDETFAHFLKIQFIFGIISLISTWVVLMIFSVNFAPSIALLSGILTIIPLIGPLLALAPPVFIALAIYPNNPLIATIIFVILFLIQQIMLNYLGPKLMGKAFKLHPIIVLLSFIVGYKIAGPFGAIFVVPLLAILVIVFKELGHYFVNPH